MALALRGIKGTQLKRFLLLALVLVVAGNAHSQTDETQQLQDFVDRYVQTWQSHDAAWLALFFAEDSDMIVGIQPRIVGRVAVEKWWREYFSRIDSGRTLSISVESVRLLAPGVALLNVTTTTGGTHSGAKEKLEARKARGTWVVIRSNGDWMISALRMNSPVGELRVAPGTDR